MPTDTYYQANGLLSSVLTPVVTVTYGYDARGNRTSVTAYNSAGPEVTRYTFDDANRLVTETNPLNKVTGYTFDNAGNRATKTDMKGDLTTYLLDDNRRLVGVSFADGSQYEFAFDSVGRRTLERSPSH